MNAPRRRRRTHSHELDSSVSFTPYLIAHLGLLIGALVLGGASRENAIPAALIELGALALLPWTVFRLTKVGLGARLIWPLAILALLTLTLVAQLIPLPPEIWTTLPHRDVVANLYRTTGMPLSWRPLSLTPSLTINAGLSLVPAATVFLGWAAFSPAERRMGVFAILGIVLLGLLFGGLQLAGGGHGPGYLYENTNYNSLVGLFSNRNHEATLLLSALPLLAALVAGGDRHGPGRRTLIIAALGVSLLVIVALAAVKSRAGVLLLAPALAAALAILIRSGALGRATRVIIVVGGLLALALMLVILFGLDPIMARFESSAVQDLRFVIAPHIWRLAVEHLPWGSGLGSFDGVFRAIEPLDTIGPQFVNHAHDDYLEVLLETGLLGVASLLAFVGWWLYASWQAWRSNGHPGHALAKAASVVIGLVIVHSAVDYPLRTIALSSVFAYACALLIPPPRRL